MVTPFDDRGQIDWPGVAKLISWHEANGMHGVVLAGTNGEGPSLSAIEKRDLARFGAQHAGKMKIILGAGTCSLPEVIWLCEQAEKAGAQAALVLPPFYFKATDIGIENWFRGLLQSTSLPIIIYNFPQTTGVTLRPEMIARLFSQFEHCIGIKDSSGDESLMDAYLQAGAEFRRAVLVGNETLILKCLNRGGSGTISGLANVFPRLISRQIEERSDALQHLINEAVAAIKKHPQPAVHKTVLRSKGLPCGTVRPPLEPLDEAAQREVIAFAQTFGF